MTTDIVKLVERLHRAESVYHDDDEELFVLARLALEAQQKEIIALRDRDVVRMTAIANLHDEIERLQAELKAAHGARDALTEGAFPRFAEIERLKGLLMEAREMCGSYEEYCGDPSCPDCVNLELGARIDKALGESKL